jgi:hypothetical protein
LEKLAVLVSDLPEEKSSENDGSILQTHPRPIASTFRVPATVDLWRISG